MVAGLLGGPTLWRIGFAVAWLVGSWLFGPKQKKNDIFDPGAEEMPRWNTALRGITMPTAFGTNRISSQIVWEHDYNVVRSSKGGGGGKFGGSGGGKGAQGSGSINYDYYWDFIYHIAMVPDRYALIKGWLGSERINNDAMGAIVAGTSGEFVFTGTGDVDQTEDQKVTMSFADSFYFSGSGPGLTGDSNSKWDGWDEINTDMGSAVRWPHTTYVGLKQLHLGSFPSVPQLSWEIGPGVFDFRHTGTGADTYSNGSYGILGPKSIFKGDNAVHYSLMQTSNLGILHSYNAETGDWTFVRTITSADILALATAFGIDTTYSNLWNTYLAVLDPGNYISCQVNASGGGIGENFTHHILFKINSAGILTCLGGAKLAGVELGPSGGKYCSIANNRTNDDPIIWISHLDDGVDHSTVMRLFPSINATIGNILSYDGTIAGYNLEVFQSAESYFFRHGSHRSYIGFCWSLPKVNGINLETRLFAYFGQSDIEAHIDNFGNQSAYVDGKTGTYPNGFIAYWDFGVLEFALVSPGFTMPSPVVDNASMLDYTTHISVFPFTDRNLYADDETTNQNAYGDYDPHPQCIKLTSGPNAGTYLIIFAQMLEDNTVDMLVNSIYSTLMRSRAFIWDPIDLIHYQLKKYQFQPASRSTDWGSSDAGTFAPTNTMLNYNEENSRLYFHGGIQGVAALNINYFGFAGNLDLGSGSDVTPPYVIYQILTSNIFGIGIATSQIDTASYNAAIAYCEENAFYISVQYRRDEPVLQIIDDLLSVYGGFLVVSNGLIKFKQLQYLDGAATSVRTIDNAHLLTDGNPPVRITKGARQDTFNRVKVNYFDRALEYAQNQVEEADEVDQDLNGVRPREFPAIFVMNETMARTMAIRALWANLYSRDTYEFKLGWKDHDLEPGDVITLVDSYHSALANGQIARIIEWKEKRRGEFEITAKQEFDYILSNSATPLNITSSSIRNRIGAIPQVRDFTMYELPAEFETGESHIYVSWASYQFAVGAKLWISADGISFAESQKIEPYQLNGILMKGLPNDEATVENVEVLMSPRTDWLISASVYYNQTLASADQPSRAVGASLIWCGSEMMAYQGVTLLAQNRYRFDKLFRGWGGTNIHAHSSGDLWYLQGGGTFYQPYLDDRIGTVIVYKVQPYNLAGAAVNISSISAKSYTIVGQHYLPQLPDMPQFFRDSEEYRGITRINVGSTIDIPLKWRDTARKSGYGARGYGYGGYGRFTPDSTAFRVEVVGSGNIVVRSTVVNSGYFSYTSSQNFSDNGAWRGNCAFKVTPYNDIGDAVKTETLSLELWV